MPMRSRDVRPIVGPIDRLLALPRSLASSASASGPLWRVLPRFRVLPLQTQLLQVARQRVRTPKPTAREPERQKALPGRPRPFPVAAYKQLFRHSRMPWARLERTYAAELVALKPDVLLAASGATMPSLLPATLLARADEVIE
jgi:hypothetical protein